MTFLWPQLLWLLLLVPLVAGAYLVVLRRRESRAVRLAKLRMMREAMGSAGARRHLPALLLLVSVATMLAAAARPAAVLRLPSHHETVILSMDVSGSMKAKDVAPDRMTAAREAAKAFVREQPSGTRIGIVEFSGSASVVQAPTHDREQIDAAIDRLHPQFATAIGSGIEVALQAIFPEGSARAAQPGSYKSAAIILLSDGESNSGPDPLQAAEMAAQHGVRVFTVGFGTPLGEMIHGEGWSMRVRLDEATLQRIADVTRAEYFHASTASGLKKVYETLTARLTLERKHIEITALFAAAAALVAMLAGGLSLAWFNRPI